MTETTEHQRLLEREERAHEKTIGERDDAEQALSQAYFLVTGRSPEWSNNWGHAECLEEIGDAVALLKAAAKDALNAGP